MTTSPSLYAQTAVRDRTINPRVLPDLHAPAWIKHAACRGAPLELFFPPDHHHDNTLGKEFCRTCPVTNECLAWGIKVDRENSYGGYYGFGVFGGMTAAERRRHATQAATRASSGVTA